HIFHTSNKAVWDFVNSFVPFNRLTLDNNYFDDEYQGIPIGGYNKLIDGLLDGIECRTNTDFFFDRLTLEALAKNIVYTGKLDEFYNYQYGKLEYHTQDGIELSSPKSDNHNRAISAHYRRIAGREPNVIFGGRLAEYKYYNMDELIEKALLMWE
ncbi:MAG: hypothetical protein LBT16_03485, partial [Treponema sp.]|nr:hypothetical protein [Treponema sp.]